MLLVPRRICRFAGLCAVYELLYRRRYGLGVIYLAVATVVPYIVGVLLFHISVVNAYTDMLPVSWQIRGWASREKMIAVVYVLYGFPMVVVFILKTKCHCDKIAIKQGLDSKIFRNLSGCGTGGQPFFFVHRFLFVVLYLTWSAQASAPRRSVPNS